MSGNEQTSLKEISLSLQRCIKATQNIVLSPASNLLIPLFIYLFCCYEYEDFPYEFIHIQNTTTIIKFLVLLDV